MISILFIFLTLLAAVVLAAIGFSIQRGRRLGEARPVGQLTEPPHLHPLFEQDETERAALLKAENDARAEADRLLAKEQNEQNISEQELGWRDNPSARTTSELIHLASLSGDAKILSRVADSVLQMWRHDGIEGLSSRDLADLLDSHFRLLPQQERTSGAMFRLKQEIAELRRESEAQPDGKEDRSDLS